MRLLPQIDVRRLAAIDMHGLNGTRRRRLVITGEFVLGATVGVALGVLVAVTSDSVGLRLFGIWVAGLCLNYVPLALHAAALLQPGRIEDELAGVDIRRELRHYTAVQFWIVIPLVFVALALVRRRPEQA